MQSAFDSTADGLLVVAPEGRVTGYNQKFVSMWRMPQAVLDTGDDQALLGHAVSQLAEPEAFLASVQSLYARPDAVSFDTLRMADGRCFERYSQPQLLDGTVVGRVWSFRDVTARLDQEQRRAELEHQLQHAHTLEALGTLSGGIAHDFNNLLMVIMGHAETSADATDETPRRASLATITEASLRASALVRQIREFSQPRPTARVVLAVADTIDSALQLMRTTMPKSIELVMRLTPHVTMFANATQVQQVVMNLAVNAAQAIGDATGRIEVTLEEIRAADAPATVPAPAAERYARLTVRDTGRGITPELLPRIFDPFFTTKTASPGSGLGLAVVQGIVRRHGGVIVVDSTPGDGTAVQVYWPALAPTATPPQPVGAVAAAPAPPRGKGRHILVVDDEPEVAKVVGQSLRLMGYAVTVETDPREALATFLREPQAIDAVLTDLSMPHLSGIELGRRILEHRPDTPVVLFTGYNADFGPDEARAMGIRAVLNKPMTSAILAEALHHALTDDPAAARHALSARPRALEHRAALHHRFDVGQGGDVEERVAVEHDDVGQLAGLHGAQVALLAEDVRANAGQGRDHLDGRHPQVDVHLGLAPQRFGVEVHRRARVGAHAEHGARAGELRDALVAEDHLAVGAAEVAESAPVGE